MAQSVVILASSPGESQRALRRLCGMTVIERAIRSLYRVGIREILIVAGAGDDAIETNLGDGQRFGVRIRYSQNPDQERGEFVTLPADQVMDLDAYSRLAQSKFDKDSLVRLESDAAFRKAEKNLLRSLRKPTDTFVTRVFNRPVSTLLSKYLCRTSLRPDTVSFLSSAVGMLSPLFLIQGSYGSFLMGAFCYHFSSVIYGCAGELARLKLQDSKRGEWIDTIADTIGHFLFVAGLVVGLYAKTKNPTMILMGAMAIFGMVALLFMMIQYLTKVAHRGSLITFERDYTKDVAEDRDLFVSLARLLKPLLRRATFAFLFFVLAVLGRADVILFLIAFGTNLALILVYFTFKRRLRVPVTERISR